VTAAFMVDTDISATVSSRCRHGKGSYAPILDGPENPGHRHCPLPLRPPHHMHSAALFATEVRVHFHAYGD
jgi:hypothetical protein